MAASMRKIGILSDTHGRLSAAAYAALADCELIVHAGDICSPGILKELETLAPVRAVLGNNDFDEYGPSVSRYAQFEFEGLRFFVAHYPEDVFAALRGRGPIAAFQALPHVCVHGHTHVPRILRGKEASPAQLIVCPGSVSRPRGGSMPSVAKLEISGGRLVSADIEAV